MYFLQFAKWFWNKHLVRTDQKVGFILVLWITGLVCAAVTAFIIKSPVALAIYLAGSLCVAALVAAISGIVYMHRRYIEWQMEVVNKLKGK